MSILINFYNQMGAGPKNISLNFINTLKEREFLEETFIIIPNVEEYVNLESKGNVKLVKLKRYTNIFSKILFRIYLDIFFIPYFISKNKISKLLAFGNFLISPVKVKKVVLLHHPYIVDNILLNKLSFLPKIIEKLKRFAFYVTIKNVDIVVVQSNYMKRLLLEVWGNDIKNCVIANPISKNFVKNYSLDEINDFIKHRLQNIDKIKILYVSRFYPHKNHIFLVDLSKVLNENNIKHEILITVDFSKQETLDLQQMITKDISIESIGEISQFELETYYKTSHIFIFPSNSETFGNPLIEAMKFGLPIVVPNLEYAQSIVEEAGIYYNQNDVLECKDSINNLISNSYNYRLKSLESFEQFKKYPQVEEWVDSYFKILDCIK
ncbi:MAG: glycosyltransferase [Aliarcobacter butzleri]|uniref:glycosyltransferase n=1 Tax=Aliarcobacter butzleri TaxID=28197 RepID=UPI001EDC0D79|nr:glycosyltransferase [Aliarcobacter butzleri]MCG3663343.1 glycosyltransferase [Aliarcobacter butzleri]MDY0192349.1 glycosyltransferase [Aliarcobacter butzleri]